MSRLGKKPIIVPKGVEIKKASDGKLNVKGPKGQLSLDLKKGILVEIKDSEIIVEVEKAIEPAFHGLYRALIANLVTGVVEGYKKELVLVGVGFRAAVKGNKLDLQIGFSHPTEIEIPQGIQVKVNKATDILIEGANKQEVGQFAALIRAIRKPEPYKGKGIRYKDEYVRKKAGKAAKAGK